MSRSASAFLLVLVFTSGCTMHRIGTESETHQHEAILLAVLADMVKTADSRTESARFVHLSPAALKSLRGICGPLYNIQEIGPAEADISTLEKRLKSQWPHQDGHILRATIEKVAGDKADVNGLFRSAAADVAVHYKLQRVGQGWRVVNARVKYAT